VQHVPVTDWVFFTSQQSVKHYLKQCTPGAKVKLACWGESTAKALRKSGYNADFIGQSTESKGVAASCKEKLNDDSVLFPISNISLGGIQEHLPLHQVKEKVFYRTFNEAVKVNEEFDHILFTSPSNVRGWLKSGNDIQQANVIAIGETTLKELKMHGISAKKAWKPSIIAMFDTLFGMY
jgi:uroporphyrinogen-III synthase